MCIRLNKDEANQRVTLGIESTKGFNEADVNENKIFRGKGKNPQSTATVGETRAYLIIVTDATDAVSVNFSGRCKFLQI